MVRAKSNKNNITYDEWLTYYKAVNIHDNTLEQHTKFSNEYQKWKVGNIEKVAGIWWNR